MAKLYPPHIEGTIPAFYKTDSGTASLVVPFSMNRAVNKSEVIGFRAQIKTVQKNEILIKDLTTSTFDAENKYEIYFTLKPEHLEKLTIGQHYKIQVAYESMSGTGYFSTVGIIKYTTKPIMSIEGLIPNAVNMHRYSYIGLYAQIDYEYTKIDLVASNPTEGQAIYQPGKYFITVDNGKAICDDELWSEGQTYFTRTMIADPNDPRYRDSSEKEYSYQFIMTNRKGEVIADSGILLHNSSNDVNSYESYDEFAFPSDLEENSSFYIQYKVITNNGMEVSSPRYRLMQKSSIAPEISTQLIATMNDNNGYIDLSLKGDVDEDGVEKAATGAFLITRACSDDNFTVWNEVYRFVLHGQHPSRWLWRDFTVEQGKRYVYSLQQYNDAGLYSARILSNYVEADFEDVFLYDGITQLKIKFNPKISSFKTDYLETKTDTIGSKYPFIFRNGNVAYKEFPIAGLISYHMDEENLFVNDVDLGLANEYSKLRRPGTLTPGITATSDDYFDQLQMNPQMAALINEIREQYREQDRNKEIIENERHRTTHLGDYNVSAERLFKLKVLDWLNNGQPKLFRSPTEGNYIVRLMNVSLTPEEQLGRMLHSFSATAYEVADCNYENLNNFGIIKIDNPSNVQLRWASVPLSTVDDMSEDKRYSKFGQIYYANGELLAGYHSKAMTVRFTDMMPGAIFYINVPPQLQNSDNREILKPYSYAIGSTGTYQLDSDVGITSIMIPNDARYQGIMTYSYYNDAQNIFNEIESIEIVEHPCEQYIGEQTNIIKQVENVKTNFINFYYLHFAKRFVADVFCKYMLDGNGFPVSPTSDSLYRDKACTNKINVIPDEEGREEENDIQGNIDLLGYYEDPFCVYRYNMDHYFVPNPLSQYQSDRFYKAVGLREYGAITPVPAREYDVDKAYYFRRLKDDGSGEYEFGQCGTDAYRFSHDIIFQRDVIYYIKNAKTDKMEVYDASAVYKRAIKDYLWLYEQDVTGAFFPTEDKAFVRGKRYYLRNATTGVYEEYKVEAKQYNNDVTIKDYLGPYILYSVDKYNFKNYYCLPEEAQILFDNSYLYLENGLYPTAYIPNISRYYTPEPFVFYYDPFNPEVRYTTQETYDRIQSFCKNLGLTVQEELRIFSHNIYINGRKLTLNENESFSIHDPIVLESVEQDCGIVLECGYETQELHYSLEHSNLQVKRAKDAHDEVLVKLSSNAMQSMCYLTQMEDETEDEWLARTETACLEYANILNEARKEYNADVESPGSYAHFINILDEAKKEWEASVKL